MTNKSLIYVYLVKQLIDNCAWSTEKVCLTKERALKELKKLEKPFNVFMIEKERVLK